LSKNIRRRVRLGFASIKIGDRLRHVDIVEHFAPMCQSDAGAAQESVDAIFIQAAIFFEPIFTMNISTISTLQRHLQLCTAITHAERK
jgi:hypothetical protein